MHQFCGRIVVLRTQGWTPLQYNRGKVVWTISFMEDNWTPLQYNRGKVIWTISFMEDNSWARRVSTMRNNPGSIRTIFRSEMERNSVDLVRPPIVTTSSTSLKSYSFESFVPFIVGLIWTWVILYGILTSKDTEIKMFYCQNYALLSLLYHRHNK